MRYSKDHKQATRQRILEAAGRRFKRDGIDGAGLATVMADAGLTNGAFYAHFSSKEDLVANVLAEQLRAQRQSLDAEPSDRAGLEAFIRSYLSPEHRNEFADEGLETGPVRGLGVEALALCAQLLGKD